MKYWKYLLLGALGTGSTMAQLTYPGCDAVQSTDFAVTEMVSRKGGSGATQDPDMSEPTRMEVQVIKKDGLYDHTNIFYVERLGNVKFFDGGLKKVTLMGKISVYGKSDNGLMGIVLDPNYETNRWLYLWYTPNQLLGKNRQLVLARYTVKSDNTLDMASAKELMRLLASSTDEWHTGGPMQFDSYGDLWGTVGNNTADLDPAQCTAGNNVLSKTDSSTSAEWGPSNTASLRGGFWRIHPDDKATTQRKDKSGTYGPGYTVPAGNFGEYWANEFEKQGKPAALVAQYRDPLKVLPEIYVKGERSNFSIAVHPTKRWLAWGTVNYSTTNDEFNLTDHPIFTGFPYFHNNNVNTCTNGQDPASPKNTSPMNSGVQDLPPATPGVLNYGVGGWTVNVAIGGPIYTFDPSLNSDVKFPPSFHNKWLLGGFYDISQKGGLYVATFDTTTLKVTNTLRIDNGIFSGVKIRNFIGAKYGADGALYILNYDGYYNSALNPSVMRVTYTGKCKVPVVTKAVAKPRNVGYQNIWLSQRDLKVKEPGRHTFTLFDLAGNKVYSATGVQGAQYVFSDLEAKAGIKRGVYLVKVETAAGEFVRQASLL
ncbi:MAG: PQQ-dependent sugar dehydrogenase [Fibrobacteria bacterium]